MVADVLREEQMGLNRLVVPAQCCRIAALCCIDQVVLVAATISKAPSKRGSLRGLAAGAVWVEAVLPTGIRCGPASGVCDRGVPVVAIGLTACNDDRLGARL